MSKEFQNETERLLRTEDEPGRDDQVVAVKEDERNKVPPVMALEDAQGDCDNQNNCTTPHPNPTQDPHVPILVIPGPLLLVLNMTLVITRWDPASCCTKNAIFDGHEVRILLDDEDEIDVEVVHLAGPKTEDKDRVDERGKGICKVVPQHHFRIEKYHHETGEGGKK